MPFDNQVEHELDSIDAEEARQQQEQALLEAELGLDTFEAGDLLDDLAFLEDMGIDPMDAFEV